MYHECSVHVGQMMVLSYTTGGVFDRVLVIVQMYYIIVKQCLTTQQPSRERAAAAPCDLEIHTPAGIMHQLPW